MIKRRIAARPMAPALAALLLSSPAMCGEEVRERVYRGANEIRQGNHFAEAVHVDFGDEAYPSDVMDMLGAMPKLRTLVVGAPGTRTAMIQISHIHRMLKRLPHTEPPRFNYAHAA